MLKIKKLGKRHSLSLNTNSALQIPVPLPRLNCRVSVVSPCGTLFSDPLFFSGSFWLGSPLYCFLSAVMCQGLMGCLNSGSSD